jgi:hypothetical protein
LLHDGDCCKSLASQVLLKGSEQKKIKGCEIRTVGRMAKNLQVILQKPDSRDFSRIGPGIFMENDENLAQKPGLP